MVRLKLVAIFKRKNRSPLHIFLIIKFSLKLIQYLFIKFMNINNLNLISKFYILTVQASYKIKTQVVNYFYKILFISRINLKFDICF